MMGFVRMWQRVTLMTATGSLLLYSSIAFSQKEKKLQAQPKLQAPQAQVFVGEKNAEHIPSLLIERDLLPPFGKNELSKKNSARLLPRTERAHEVLFSQRLTQYLLGSYRFLGDFEERPRMAYPPGWILPRQNPSESLLLGDPYFFERPNVEIVLPVYRVLHLPFIKTNAANSDDSNVLRFNTAMSFWRKNDVKRAQELFDLFANDALEAVVPYDDPVVRATWIARGFFYLDLLAVNRRAEDLTLNSIPRPTPKPSLLGANSNPQEHGQEKGKEASSTPTPNADEDEKWIREEHNRLLVELKKNVDADFKGLAAKARDSFIRAFFRTNIETFFPNNTNLDREIFERTLDCPVFLEPRGGFPVRCERNPLQRNMDVVDWLRVTAIPVLWNAAVMQRKLGDWTTVFDNSDAIELILKRLNQSFLSSVKWRSDTGEALVPPPIVTASAPYGVWPRNHKDMRAAMHFLRAFGMQSAHDPLEIWRNADIGIRAAASPELVSLGFLYAANTFFDMNFYSQARRTFAWCESASESFSEKAPGCLLFGAESAFWEGNFDLAARGFEKFLHLSADPNYGPWASFRLALIAQLRGRKVEAEQRYAELMRLYPGHPVFADSLVRNSCLQIAAKEFDYDARKKVIDAVQNGIEKSRQNLKLQAETCLLQSKLQTATDDAKNRNEMVNDAKTQLGILENYEKAFPESPFAALFEDRAKEVKFAFVVGLSDLNQCEALQTKYEEQAKALEKLGNKAKPYLPALEWGDEERKIVMRCAALTKNLPLWAILAKTKIGTDGGVTQKRLYDFHKSKESLAAALNLARALEKQAEAKRWILASREVDAGGNDYVRNKDFWLGISLDRLLRFDLVKPASQTREIHRVLLASVNKSPLILFQSEMLCGWAMRETSRFSEKLWDDIAKLKKTPEWLELFERKVTSLKTNSERCVSQIASSLLIASKTKPSKMRDEILLRPYLEKKGVAAASDEWLVYAQRQERRQGPSREVRTLYERLSREGSSETIKGVSRLWLNEHQSLSGG